MFPSSWVLGRDFRGVSDQSGRTSHVFFFPFLWAEIVLRWCSFHVLDMGGTCFQDTVETKSEYVHQNLF